MTYNVGNGLARPDRLAHVLAASKADIIGLQELTTVQEDALRTRLQRAYPYQVLHGAGIPGKGLLSRYPITGSERLELFPHRPDLLATLDVAGRELKLIVAHPPPPRLFGDGIRPTELAMRQLEHLVKLACEGEPAILLGDFNMRETMPIYRHLEAAGLTDAFRVVGRRGSTFPLRRGRVPLRPLLRLDYIWHSTHLRTVDARIGSDAGSDHLPVLAEMHW
jgi:endonuclease/exonuclease/phosphatase family metal-dependent hydrolase